MNTDQFSALAIDGAHNYYNYLEAKGRGREEINVDRIQKEDALYLLRLSKNPFSTDAIVIKIKNREFSQRELEIVEHDRDNRVLYIRAAKEITDPFTDVNPQDVCVISDLKFLIERVRVWYENNGDYLHFPCPVPNLPEVEMIQSDLSSGQIQAVRDVFSYPQTYVWGAPGTGKTRYVLAECLLQYCKAGAKVAVLAPTNHAIEQVLYGILDKLQAHGIQLDRVIRLGTPTTKFADQYASICEVQGIDKQLHNMQKQIVFLENVLKHRSFLKRLTYAEEIILPAFSELLRLIKHIMELNLDLQTASNLLKATEHKQKSIYAEQLSAERALSIQQRHMQSLGYRIGSKLSSSAAQEGRQKLSELQQSVEQSKLQHDAAMKEQELAEQQVRQKRSAVSDADRAIDQEIREVKAHLSTIERFVQLGLQLNRSNAESCQGAILEFIQAGQKVRADGLERFAEYRNWTEKDIQNRISEIEIDKRILEAQTTDKRLENAQIVAATVDTFLSRQQPRDYEGKFPFAHIFLDEAGYCSLIKGAILFGYHCPVTMLGDHMQLPPVCEADEKELSKEQNGGVFLFAQSALFTEEILICDSAEELLNQYLNHGQPRFVELHRSNLCETYRFGPTLASALDKHVYQNGFQSADESLEFIIEVLDAPRMPGGEKRQNPAEAEIIKERISMCGTNDYAILTPYRNQVALLGRTLPDDRREQRIMTIHASQGREWDTVFVSVVDTSDMYFTNSRRPELGGLQIINTAVSRAKHRLIIACDKSYWLRQDGQLITELVRMEE